jgi:GTPase involved in cell partitioning and DNA repair
MILSRGISLRHLRPSTLAPLRWLVGSRTRQHHAPDSSSNLRGAAAHTQQGREFLRHLRRTRLVLHVVDVAEADPVADYLTVRDELRMYNPEFVRRPHVVALNKADVLGDGGAEWIDSIRRGILAAYDAHGVRPPKGRWRSVKRSA